MGEIRAKTKLINQIDVSLHEAGHLKKRAIRARNIEAVVDTGAVMTLLPQDLVEDLGLQIAEKVVVLLANDQKIELPKARGLLLTVSGRTMAGECLVGPPGCEPLLGQIVMESLDLIVDPVKRTLTPRPESPFLPTLKLKNFGLPLAASWFPVSVPERTP